MEASVACDPDHIPMDGVAQVSLVPERCGANKRRLAMTSKKYRAQVDIQVILDDPEVGYVAECMAVRRLIGAGCKGGVWKPASAERSGCQ